MEKTDYHKKVGYQEPPLGVNSEKNERIFCELLQKVGEPILWVDSFGRIDLASIEAVKLFGSPLLGIKFWERFKDEEFGFSMRETLRYGLSYPLLHQRIFEKDFEICVSFLVTGVLVIFKDQTSQRQLIEMNTKTERMKTLGEMSSQLAHELKNPLAGIRGYAALLQKDLTPFPHLQEMASQIIEGAKILEELVSAILEYARPLRLTLETTDLGVLVRQVVRLFRADPAFPTNIQIEQHIPPKAILAPVDAQALQRALLNLLINAKDAMPTGGIITVTVFEDETKCQIGITDTGIGIKEQDFSFLFTPHFTTKRHGNGLGLVETKKIIDGHKALIDVRSYPNKGSVFTLIFGKER